MGKIRRVAYYKIFVGEQGRVTVWLHAMATSWPAIWEWN